MVLILYAFSFLTIGHWLALRALKKNWLPKQFLYIGGLMASLTLCYGLFYLYLLNTSLAGAIVRILFVLSVGLFILLILEFKKSAKTFALVRSFFLIPLLITGTVMFAYSSIFYSCVPKTPSFATYNEINNGTFCHIATLPFDNSLDFIFASNVLNHQPKKQAIDWNLVDRPPLQIAATLPILGQLPHASKVLRYFSYYQFAIFLQLAWVAAFWGAFQILKIAKKYQLLLFVALATTGFFYQNSIFVWPKLLAASLVVSGIVTLLTIGKVPKYNYLPFAALAISLGLLSHTDVLFTVLPFSILYAIKVIHSRKIHLKYFATAILIAIVMLVPWFIYKDSITSSDRLIKWHLAGITSASDKRSTVTTIIDQYKTLTFTQWLRNKEANVKTLVNGGYTGEKNCPLDAKSILNKCVFTEWRVGTFFSVTFAFEAFNLGWLALIYRLIKKQIDRLDIDILIILASSLIFWVLLMFMPNSTIVHQGSYATMMLVFLLLAKNLSAMPYVFMASIAALQSIIFFFAWIAAFLKIP